ncbi:MAG: hypothetical protein NT154_18335 [Verrucomicrobia bacterium]|nr:hypothetical protein [Verrucomicrobiota bacterium]
MYTDMAGCRVGLFTTLQTACCFMATTVIILKMITVTNDGDNRDTCDTCDGRNKPARMTKSLLPRPGKRSPLYRLIVLLARTYRQPGRLPTIEQGAELERLLAESERLLTYRASHPNWRQEEPWS